MIADELAQGSIVGPEYFQGQPGSELERLALATLTKAGLRPPEMQYYFGRPRQWRADFAYPRERVMVEIQGGTWAKKRGGHSTGSGIQADMVKHNAAALLGWVVLCYSDHGIKDGSMVEDVRRALAMRAPERKETEG